MSARTDIHIILKCSECGSALEVDSDKGKTKMEYNSASNAESHLAIKPCHLCISKYTLTAKNLVQALKELERI